MADSSDDQQPQLLPARAYRQSATSGIARLWRMRQDATATTTPQPGKSFVVPLFLSRSSQNTFARGALPSSRSRTSIRSVIEANTIPSAPRPLSLPRSDGSEYSDTYDEEPHAAGHGEAPVHTQANSVVSRSSTGHTSHSHRSDATRNTNASKRSGRKHSRSLKKAMFRHPAVRTKARIAFAFGSTTLIALLIYLVLAGTGVGKGILFHVLSILLLLTMTGIFLHQLIRMFMLAKQPRRARQRRAQTVGGRSIRTDPRTGRRYEERRRRHVEPEHIPKKPIPVHLASDVDTGFEHDLEACPVVQHPPPVYGNNRGSMRINPSLLHWREIEQKRPSPSTPTYEEALRQVQQTVLGGYRPPSYLSEHEVRIDNHGGQHRRPGGISVVSGDSNIHPLERERLRGLTRQALEGNR